jgi:adenylylsulfate kinase
MPKGDFIEIYCKASLEVCEGRDVKGLYKRARAGEIKNYTGIDSPYEIPKNPELIIDTDKESLEESVSKIFSFLESKGVFK